MNQLNLFQDGTTRGMHRRRDPVTSREAAREIVNSGQLDGELRIVVEALKRHPGTTATELQQFVEGAVVHKRMKKLEDMGLVRRCAPRKCRITGRMATEWWVT